MPSELNGKIPKGLDDVFDLMTRDATSERYATVDDILDDINRIEGLAELLGPQAQVLAAENPLQKITFRPQNASTKKPLSSSSEASLSTSSPPAPPSSKKSDSESKATHRPYSFQQRHKQSK